MPFRHDTPTIPRDIPLHELTDTELDALAARVAALAARHPLYPELQA